MWSVNAAILYTDIRFWDYHVYAIRVAGASLRKNSMQDWARWNMTGVNVKWFKTEISWETFLLLFSKSFKLKYHLTRRVTTRHVLSWHDVTCRAHILTCPSPRQLVSSQSLIFCSVICCCVRVKTCILVLSCRASRVVSSGIWSLF